MISLVELSELQCKYNFTAEKTGKYHLSDERILHTLETLIMEVSINEIPEEI